MSLLQEQMNQRLAEIISRLNQWELNAKKTSEFDALLTANPEALIRVQLDGESKKIPIGTILSAIPSALPDGVVTNGTIDREAETNNFTFTGFTVRINSTLYSNASPIERTISVADEGFKRIDIAIMDTLGNISIIQGVPDEDVAIEPTTPPSTVKLRQFVIVGDVVDLGPGVGLPYDINLLDELLQNPQPGDYLLISVSGIDFRVDFQRFINVLGGGSQNLQEVTDEGSTTTNSISSTLEMFVYLETNDEIFSAITVNTILEEAYLAVGKAGSVGRITNDGTLTDDRRYVVPNENGTLATREWTENLLEGLKTKQPVRVATTANITLSGIQTIDGVALSVDDRVLVKDQTTQTNNGIYLVKSGSWERSTDANAATELTNAVVSVLEGTANGQSTFRQTTTSITLGSSNIVWAAFGTSVPDATPTTKGKAKLFNALGNNTDGALNQAVVTNELLKLTPFHHLVNRQLSYFLPRNNSALFVETLRVNSLVLNGNATSSDRDANIIFSTSAVAGNVIRQRGGVFTITHESNWYYDICLRFRANSNINDSRFFIGISNSFLVTDPTNVEPTTFLNTIGLGKLSTSDNLHIIHNDNTGLATTIDLGVNYPMTDVTEYYYDLRIQKLYGTTDAIVTVTRYDSAGNEISTQNTLTSDLPSGITNLSPFAFITNNATASEASFRHYGCVLKQGRF
jgi:hypothetical protein